MKTFQWLFVAILLAFASSNRAAVYYWTNTGEGLWNTPGNWQSNAVPTSTDDARVNNGGTNLVDSSQTVTIGQFTIGDTNTTSGTLRMTGGSITTTVSDVRIGGNSATAAGVGIFNFSGGTLLMNFGNLNVGFGSNAVGTINMSDGLLQVNTSGAIFAVGNRGTATVNQSGGIVYLHTGTGLTQLGRNVAAGFGFGTYNLSGGTLATAKLYFGNAVGTGPVSTNIFSLSGTGTLITTFITNINTSASNYFNFTGGTLTAMTNAITITNSGGTFSPATVDFTSSAGTNLASLPINPVGTNYFTASSSYIQTSGTLAIDIAGAGNNDFLDIGATNSGDASIAGTISVRLLNGYNPPLGATFDILAARSIMNTASIVGNLNSAFSASTVSGTDGRQILRLTITHQPVVTPRLTGTTKLGNGAFRFTFTNSPNATFTVIGTNNVAASGWPILGTAVETSSGNYQFTDTSATNSNQRFYQVRWP